MGKKNILEHTLADPNLLRTLPLKLAICVLAWGSEKARPIMSTTIPATLWLSLDITRGVVLRRALGPPTTPPRPLLNMLAQGRKPIHLRLSSICLFVYVLCYGATLVWPISENKYVVF